MIEGWKTKLSGEETTVLNFPTGPLFPIESAFYGVSFNQVKSTGLKLRMRLREWNLENFAALHRTITLRAQYQKHV